jgi:fermentation-respiration switch protein FrsA (DUF1100 family)
MGALPAIFLTAALIGGVLLYLLQQAAYYPLPYPAGDWDERDRLGAEDAWIATQDHVRLHGWFLAVPGAKRTILFLHGNAGNLTHRAGAMRAIAAAGSSTLVLDYRGYGRSEGTPTEAGLYRDADAGYEWLLRRGVAPSALIIHGESLGTAVAVELASRVPCAGLVLEAPFPSARAVVSTMIPGVGALLTWGFDSASRMPRVHVPLLVIHGDEDEVIPIDLGRKVFAAAREPKRFWTVPGGHHNDLREVAGAAYTRTLREFYGSLEAQIR